MRQGGGNLALARKPRMENRAIFRQRLLPYLLIFPQVLISVVFFYGPASEMFTEAFLLTNPFGGSSKFVWFQNFERLFDSPEYQSSLLRTATFSICTMVLSVGLGLLFAVAANRVRVGAMGIKTLLIVPYAIAPAIAGVLWLFLFHPAFGVLAFAMRNLGVAWNPLLNGNQAMTLVIVASSWKEISYNFIFFLAGLQAIPLAMVEAAAVDGADRLRRFWYIVLPLLSPTMFFLAVVNLVYAFFDTFGVIDAVTKGGPGQATNTMIYKVYFDGFVGLNLGSSSAESAVLTAIVIGLTVVQFRYVERRVQYELV